MTTEKRERPDCDLWRIVWHALAANGLCDEWAGAECRRVTAEWIAAGRPIGRAEFIMEHASRGEVGKPKLRVVCPDWSEPV